MDKKQHHILPIGTWSGPVHNPKPGQPTEIIQVITPHDVETLARILNAKAQEANWPGILLDVDHESESLNKRSVAAGWYKGPFEVRNDGLWADVELTPLGADLITSKKYKRLSPTPSLVANAAGEYHPVGIHSVALTNRPRMRELTLVTNSEEPIVLQITPQPEPQKVRTMNEELLKLLGLPSTATEDEAIASVKVLNQKVDDLALVITEGKADAFIAEHGDKFADAPAARALYVQNSTAALALVANLKKVDPQPATHQPATPQPAPEEAARVLNRAETTTPVVDFTGEAAEGKSSPSIVKVNNRARELNEGGMAWAVAWERAKAEIL